MSRTFRNIFVVIIAVAALVGTMGTALAAETASPDVDADKLVTADVVSPDQPEEKAPKVLATVGENEITDQDVNMVLATLSPQQQMMFSTEYGRNKILQELVNKELIYLWAEEHNIDESELFQKDLESVKRSLMTNHAMRDILSKVEVTDEDVAKYYDEHTEEFVEPEEVNASHILVESEDQAIEIMAEIEGEKLTFEEAAKEYSTGPSAEKGGELGFFAKGQMVPEFEKAAFELETGKISEPVKSQYGWHIIKVTDKKPSKQKTLEESKGKIYETLMNERQFKIYNDTLEELKGTYEIEIMSEEKEDTETASPDETGEKVQPQKGQNTSG